MPTRIPLPTPGSINTGLSSLTPRTAQEILGWPAIGSLGSDCGQPSAALNSKLVRANVGPFAVEAHMQAIRSLTAIFKEAEVAHPGLTSRVATAGCLCVRAIRGTQSTPSNHSWGIAIDLEIDGQLVPLGADYALQGLLDLYPFFHAHGWFWGAGFHRPDSMHFEVAEETLRQWARDGLA